jgi:asparagine synthase (glutamine-hydrolysing)
MCGIAGTCYLREPEPISPELINRMLGAISHRGPDESGIYVDDWAGIGNVRLSIIDLTGGIQPIHSEDETLWIVYNGEVFNFPELRQELKRKGHRFYTNTDAEVVLHLYESKGPSCLDDLNGQFAFAIWNNKDKELFLARDHVGICPLHYTIQGNRILFASEVKAIFMDKEVKREIDPVAMDQIFTFWSTLSGYTVFKDIKELQPGHYLKISNGQVTLKKYWDIPCYSPEEQVTWSLDDVCERFLELLNASIRIRLRADVPVGSYLSGGLDSSGITSLVNKNCTNTLRTFGIHFEEGAFDERDYQNQMVSFLQTDHTNIEVKNKQIGLSFPEVLWHCETPLLRTGPVPLFLLSQEVQNSGFKVVITGEGADEVIGGYNIYREAKVRKFWARNPDSTWRPLLIGKLYPYIFNDKTRAKNYFRSFFGTGLNEVDDPFYSHFIRWRNTSKIKGFFSNELLAEINGYSRYEDLKEQLPTAYEMCDYLSKAQYLEMSIFLSNFLLSSQGERVAMAHAVEARPPYLDHRIIDFMGQVPSKWKIMGLNEKYMLKKAFQEYLPDTILNRPKQPFRAPISESLVTGNESFINEMLSDHSLKQSNLFNTSKITLLLNKLQKGQKVSEFNNMALAGILSSQSIFDQFIENFPKKFVTPVVPELFFDRRSN